MLGKIVKDIKRKVIGLKSVVLFGSLAKGEKIPSDVDLLVIATELPSEMERNEMGVRLGFKYLYMGLQPSFLFFTPEEFDSMVEHMNPLALEISKNHKILLDDGFFASEMKKVKKLSKKFSVSFDQLTKTWINLPVTV